MDLKVILRDAIIYSAAIFCTQGLVNLYGLGEIIVRNKDIINMDICPQVGNIAEIPIIKPK